MEQLCVEDTNPLIITDKTKKLKKSTKVKMDIILAAIVLVCTIATLICIAFQLKMFTLYLDLKDQALQSRHMIERLNQTAALKTQARRATDSGFVGSNNWDQNIQSDSLSSNDTDIRNSYSESESSSGELVVSRRKRHDEADDPRNNRQSRTRGNRPSE